MPKTSQPVADRVAQKVRKVSRKTQNIANTSPDSESKDQMKQRMSDVERVTYGDSTYNVTRHK